MKMLLWFLAILTPVYSAYYTLLGRVYISSPEAHYTDAPFTPNYYLSLVDWNAKEDKMKESWKKGERLNDSFIKRGSGDASRCMGHFRASQTACHQNGSIVDCLLETSTHKHVVIILLGFELRVTASIDFFLEERPNIRTRRLSLQGRKTLQIYRPGNAAVSRNTYLNFNLTIGCPSARCSLHHLALLAYQAKYDPVLNCSNCLC